MPGLNGFIGEFLIMVGAFRWDPRYVVVAGLGVILSAVYMLWMVQRVYYGKVTRAENAHLPDVTVREWAGLAPLCIMALVMGIVPTLFTKPMEPAVRRMVERVQPAEPVRVRNLIENSEFRMQAATVAKPRGDIQLASLPDAATK
jgi:NADH-quinone oxidoreductase subunit M